VTLHGAAACVVGAPCLAAAGQLSGGAVKQQYSGDAAVHVAGMNTPPARIDVTVHGIPASGTYTVSVWYENNLASDGFTEPRDLTLLVNGRLAAYLRLAVTRSWYEVDSKVATAQVRATSGSADIALECAPGDTCHVNIYQVELSQQARGNS
jgi:hypothetical protein